MDKCGCFVRELKSCCVVGYGWCVVIWVRDTNNVEIVIS